MLNRLPKIGGSISILESALIGREASKTFVKTTFRNVVGLGPTETLTNTSQKMLLAVICKSKGRLMPIPILARIVLLHFMASAKAAKMIVLGVIQLMIL